MNTWIVATFRLFWIMLQWLSIVCEFTCGQKLTILLSKYVQMQVCLKTVTFCLKIIYTEIYIFKDLFLILPPCVWVCVCVQLPTEFSKGYQIQIIQNLSCKRLWTTQWECLKPTFRNLQEQEMPLATEPSFQSCLCVWFVLFEHLKLWPVVYMSYQLSCSTLLQEHE